MSIGNVKNFADWVKILIGVFVLFCVIGVTQIDSNLVNLVSVGSVLANR